MLDTRGRLRSLSVQVADIGGPWLLLPAIERLRLIDPRSLPEVAGTPRVGPCVGGVAKIIGVRMNYEDHLAVTDQSANPGVISELEGPNSLVSRSGVGKELQAIPSVVKQHGRSALTSEESADVRRLMSDLYRGRKNNLAASLRSSALATWARYIDAATAITDQGNHDVHWF